jgi:hypothetical protein
MQVDQPRRYNAASYIMNKFCSFGNRIRHSGNLAVLKSNIPNGIPTGCRIDDPTATQ